MTSSITPLDIPQKELAEKYDCNPKIARSWEEYIDRVINGDPWNPINSWFKRPSGKTPVNHAWDVPARRNLKGYSLENLHVMHDKERYNAYAPLGQVHEINIHLLPSDRGAVVTLDFIDRHLPRGYARYDHYEGPNVFAIQWLEEFEEITLQPPHTFLGIRQPWPPMTFVGQVSLKWNLVRFGDDGRPTEPPELFTFFTEAWITKDRLSAADDPEPVDLIIGSKGSNQDHLVYDTGGVLDENGFLLNVRLNIEFSKDDPTLGSIMVSPPAPPQPSNETA